MNDSMNEMRLATVTALAEVETGALLPLSFFICYHTHTLPFLTLFSHTMILLDYHNRIIEDTLKTRFNP